MSEETYKGEKIEIKSDEKEPKLIIGGKDIPYSIDVETKKYFSYSLIPYTTFNSIMDLAKALVSENKV